MGILIFSVSWPNIYILQAFAQPNIASNTIGIVTAMNSEGQAVAKFLHNKRIKQLNGISYTIGQYANKSIVLVTTGIGKVNAAALTATLITQFHPKVTLLSGIAGTLRPSLRIGDIVVGKNVYEIEHETINGMLGNDAINPHTHKANP